LFTVILKAFSGRSTSLAAINDRCTKSVQYKGNAYDIVQCKNIFIKIVNASMSSDKYNTVNNSRLNLGTVERIIKLLFEYFSNTEYIVI